MKNMIMTQQTENLNGEIETIKKNQMNIMTFKSSIKKLKIH